ncbi:hypothetical protein AGLY_000716 [Aphis glycines]|uniref:Uncharacterized protein n=1 Tax=Aphis glycines TaxID=307491 RepID=A0A6G0U898_APHGL|nr:hypothetical protein AGLY_000716 [Aphis glycines]
MCRDLMANTVTANSRPAAYTIEPSMCWYLVSQLLSRLLVHCNKHEMFSNMSIFVRLQRTFLHPIYLIVRLNFKSTSTIYQAALGYGCPFSLILVLNFPTYYNNMGIIKMSLIGHRFIRHVIIISPATFTSVTHVQLSVHKFTRQILLINLYNKFAKQPRMTELRWRVDEPLDADGQLYGHGEEQQQRLVRGGQVHAAVEADEEHALDE